MEWRKEKMELGFDGKCHISQKKEEMEMENGEMDIV